MSPGSKNGVSYGTLDYSKSPTNYFEAYVRGVSSQLRAWNMGSFYWPGLRDGDWYSMTTKSGSGANTTLTVSNQSGLQQLQNAWTGPLAGTGGAGAGGAGTGGSGIGGKTGNGGSGAATGGSGAAGGGTSSSVGGRGGSQGTGGAVGGSSQGTGGAATGGRLATGGTTTSTAGATGGSSSGTTSSSSGGALSAGGALASGGAATRTGGAPAVNSTVSNSGANSVNTGGSEAIGNSGGATTGRAQDTVVTNLASDSKTDSSGCACSVGETSRGGGARFSFVLGALGVAAWGRSRRRATVKLATQARSSLATLQVRGGSVRVR